MKYVLAIIAVATFAEAALAETPADTARVSPVHQATAPAHPDVKASQTPHAKAPAQPDMKATQTLQPKAPAHPDVKTSQTPNAKAPGHPDVKATETPQSKAPAHPHVKAPQTLQSKAPVRPDTHTLQSKTPTHPDVKATQTPQSKAPAHPDVKATTSSDLKAVPGTQAKPQVVRPLSAGGPLLPGKNNKERWAFFQEHQQSFLGKREGDIVKIIGTSGSTGIRHNHLVYQITADEPKKSGAVQHIELRFVFNERERCSKFEVVAIPWQ